MGRRSARPPYSTLWATLLAAVTTWSGPGTPGILGTLRSGTSSMGRNLVAGSEFLRPVRRTDGLVVAADVLELGHEALRPRLHVVLPDLLAHRPHPPAELLRLRPVGLEQRGLHPVN